MLLLLQWLGDWHQCSSFGQKVACKGSLVVNNMKKPESHRNNCRDTMPKADIWTDGLICAFEFVQSHVKTPRSKLSAKVQFTPQTDVESQSKDVGLTDASTQKLNGVVESGSHSEVGANHWVPIGWERINELAQMVQPAQISCDWSPQQFEYLNEEDDRTVADLVAPYWESPAGPIWWCHVAAGYQFIDAWLKNAQWLHPAISIALRDESRLISERMKYLLYEVPVRVAGGLLFELLGQSVGDPHIDEDDIPVVLRSWQAQNFLITALHLKGHVSNVNVLGITEVQELLCAGGYNLPRTVHEVIAHLTCRLTRWDDRLFRKNIFGAADEIELKFVNRRNHEDMNLFCVILNQEIRKLSRQVIRVKWSLHAREEIVFELLQHLRGNTTKNLLEGIRKSTREMIEEQEAVRGRLFTIQDVMQSTVRAWLQDRSLRVTHNLAVFGGCGLVLSIITGLFGINVDGIPGASDAPYTFGLFAGLLVLLGVILIAVGLLYLGLQQPLTENQVEVRKLELQELVKMFQHEAETHAQVTEPEFQTVGLEPPGYGDSGAVFKKSNKQWDS
ncbi:Mg2+ transporter protein, CorA-like/Zinc transport protein ZntB [Dillenia turbinata]|uniref:Mg2+ transporter protein, CorA-like/Zinc transport protein ZntB n=1 Tax=Dillenia turbinata TaxID=194707 RepID=A0AAN8VDV6_9MAGN